MTENASEVQITEPVETSAEIAQSNASETQTEELPAQENTEEISQENPQQEDTEKKPPHKRNGFQRRISKFQNQIDLLARENEILRERISNQSKNPEIQQNNYSISAQQKIESGAPSIDQFTTYDDYIGALTEYKVEQKLIARERQQEEQKIQKTYESQIRDAEEKYEDFYDVIEDCDFGAIPMEAKQAILQSDIGADLSYHIAKNPEIWENLANMQGVRAAMYVGELAASVRQSKQGGKNSAPKKSTGAPPPLKPLTGSEVKSRNISDADIPYEEYVQLRMKQKY
jgi:hypothetical protein